MNDTVVLMDAHVHVYPRADASALLDAAARHFQATAEQLGATRWHAVLFLTEVAETSWFDAVAATRGGQVFGSWNVAAATDDRLQLEATREGMILSIVAGRQIVTAERVEVHALGTRERIPDGLDIEATITAVRAAHALIVLPWGVGKWLGKRRRLVEGVLSSSPDVQVSDNGGRPAFWSESILARAREAGRPVLSGSDPLPLPAEENRVGGFGCWMTASSHERVATEALLTRLRHLKFGDLHSYGSPETAWRFLVNQLALRIRRVSA